MRFSPKATLGLLFFGLSNCIVMCSCSQLGDDIPTLYPGSILRNTTIGRKRLINVNGISHGGQFLFKVFVRQFLPAAVGAFNRVSVSTCSKQYKLDTILMAYSRNPLLTENRESQRPINFNVNDCGKQSTIELSISSSPMFVLLAGYSGEEGPFEIHVKSLPRILLGSIPWGLDRIDQRHLPLNGHFSVTHGGQGVYAYILDSGVRCSHKDFLGTDGSSRALYGTDVVERKREPFDGTGHGTHVAAIVAGSKFGVAKNATIISVRVLNRNGVGYIARLVEGLQWTMHDIKSRKRTPAVIVMSLSSSFSETLNNAVEEVVKGGTAVITAAGNAGKDSCSFSPASSKYSISVGATRRDDTRSKFSNFGNCIDIYAPGESINSAWHTGDHAEMILSGTSAACPHVAGTIAVLLAENPAMKPSEIESVIYSTATFSLVKNHSVGTISNSTVMRQGVEKQNRLIYVRSIPSIPSDGEPKKGNMFLYVIYGISSSDQLSATCELSPYRKSAISKLLKSHRLNSDARIGVKINTRCKSGANHSDWSNNEAAWSTTRMIVRLQTKDILAGAVFQFLSDFSTSDEKNQELRSILNSNVKLLAEPWVVDSRGLKYWTAPTIMNSSETKASTSLLLAIAILASLLLIICIVFAGYLCQRRTNAKKKAKQELFEKMATQFEKTTLEQSNLANIEGELVVDYPKESIKRRNTELQGSILRDANPGGALQTPRVGNSVSSYGTVSARSFKGLKETASNFGEWASRSRNGFSVERSVSSAPMARRTLAGGRLSSFRIKDSMHPKANENNKPQLIRNPAETEKHNANNHERVSLETNLLSLVRQELPDTITDEGWNVNVDTEASATRNSTVESEVERTETKSKQRTKPGP